MEVRNLPLSCNYHVSGVTFSAKGWSPVASVEVYYPLNDTWIELPPLPILEDGGQYTQTSVLYLPEQAVSPGPVTLLGGFDEGRGMLYDNIFALDWTDQTGFKWVDKEENLSKHHHDIMYYNLFISDNFIVPGMYHGAVGVPNNFISLFQ